MNIESDMTIRQDTANQSTTKCPNSELSSDTAVFNLYKLHCFILNYGRSHIFWRPFKPQITAEIRAYQTWYYDQEYPEI